MRNLIRTEKPCRPCCRKIWHDHTISPENSVDCVYEEQSRKFRVDRIGAQSTIAKLYGMSPVSYACKSGNSYDEVVSEAYTHVLRSGKPRYDHVLAALRMPDNVVRWVPYQMTLSMKATPMCCGRANHVTIMCLPLCACRTMLSGGCPYQRLIVPSRSDTAVRGKRCGRNCQNRHQLSEPLYLEV